jgi:hypothetical protein
MNPIRLSKNWPILVESARQAKLTSTQPATVQQFVDDLVDGPEQMKASVFVELLQYLAEQDRLHGRIPLVIDLGKNNASKIEQGRKSSRNGEGSKGRAGESPSS